MCRLLLLGEGEARARPRKGDGLRAAGAPAHSAAGFALIAQKLIPLPSFTPIASYRLISAVPISEPLTPFR